MVRNPVRQINSLRVVQLHFICCEVNFLIRIDAMLGATMMNKAFFKSMDDSLAEALCTGCSQIHIQSKCLLQRKQNADLHTVEVVWCNQLVTSVELMSCKEWCCTRNSVLIFAVGRLDTQQPVALVRSAVVSGSPWRTCIPAPIATWVMSPLGDHRSAYRKRLTDIYRRSSHCALFGGTGLWHHMAIAYRGDFQMQSK